MAYNRIMHIIPDGLDELMINNIKAWSGCQDFQCSAEPACIFGGNATTLCLTVMSGDYFYANQAAIVHRPDRNSNMILIVGYRFSIEEKSRFHRHGIDFIEIEIGSDVNRMEQTFLTSLSFFIDRYRTWFDLKNKINNYIEDSFQIVVANIKLDQANKKINELNHRLEISSRTDFLTRLLNRRAIYELMEIEINRSRRLASDVAFFTSDHPRPDEPDSLQSVFRKERELNDYVGVFSIALCDIDHFKQLNDQYGHLEGDNILRALGSLFSDRTIFARQMYRGGMGERNFCYYSRIHP